MGEMDSGPIGYATNPSTDVHVPVIAERMSLPQVADDQVELADHLPLERAAQLRSGEGVLREDPPAVCDLPARYHAVRGSEYFRVAERLVKSGVAQYTDVRPTVINGLFAVLKNADGDRIIVDLRRGNCYFREPPDSKLPAIESLSKLAVRTGQRLHAGILDLDSYYHRLRLPARYQTYFGLPAVSMPDGSRRWLVWRTVPMGWSWAVALAQESHAFVIARKRLLVPEADGSVPLASPVPRLLSSREPLVSLYIDDLISVGVSRRSVNRRLRGCRLAEIVPVQERKFKPASAGEATRLWGICLDEDGVFRPDSTKLPALLAATADVAGCEFVQVKRLQHVVGKWLWLWLLMRPVLSVFRPLFKQCRSRRRTVRLWKSSRASLALLVKLLPLLCVDPARPAGAVVASDSSSFGGAVCVDFEAARLWRLLPFVYYKGRPDLQTEQYHSGLARQLRGCRFTTEFSWRWRNPEEFITFKEARAMLAGIHRVTAVKAMFGHRHLLLVDNQAVVGAVTKGCSSSPVLNDICRTVAALTLATGSTFDLAWTPTDLQPADRGSRRP
jgi:hypothetical protein